MHNAKALIANKLFHNYLLPMGFLALAWLFFFWRILTPVAEDRLTFQQGDFTLQFLAYRQLAYKQIQDSRYPVFEECLYSGYPFQADPQSQVLYPPVIGTMLIGKSLGWSVYPLQALEWEVMLHVLLALAGMFAFLRTMRLHPIAAAFGALAFGFSGFMTGYAILQTAILETAAWLPLVMLLLFRLSQHPMDSSSRLWLRDAVLLAFMVYCSYTAGHPQTLLFIVYAGTFAYIYWCHKARLSAKQTIIRAGFAAVLAILLSAAQLIPSLSFMLASTRAGLSYTSAGTGFALQDIVLLVLTGVTNVWHPLYVGIPALVFAVAAFSSRAKTANLWLLLAIGALVISFGANTFGFDLAYLVAPGYRQFHSQERHAVIVVFSLAVLSSMGVHGMLRSLRLRHRRRIFVTAKGLGILVIAAFTLLTSLAVYSRVALPDSASAGQITDEVALLTLSLTLTCALLLWRVKVAPVPRYVWGVVLLLILCFDLFTANRYTATQDYAQPFAELPLAEPIREANDVPTDLRSMGAYRVYNHYGLPLNGACVNGLNEITGGSPIVLQFYRDFINRVPEDVYSRLLNVHYTVTWRGGMGTDNGSRIPAVRIATDQYQGIDANTFLLQWDEPAVRPVWIASRLSFAASADELYARLSADDYDPASEAVLYERDQSVNSASGSGSAALEGKSTGYMKIIANTDAPAMLVVSEAFHWNWVALVNGVEIAPVLVNGALLGVPVPAGTTSVELSYRPLDLYVGAVVSLCGLIIAAAVLVRTRKSVRG